AATVGDITADQREVSGDCRLEHAIDVVETAHLLSGREVRAEAHRRIERRNAGAAGANALREGALRQTLELDLPVHPRLLERRGLLASSARRTADHLLDLASFDQLVRV